MSSRPFALVLLAAALCVSGCRKNAEEQGGEAQNATPLKVTTIAVGRRTIIERWTVDGTITALPGNDVQLSPQTPGRLSQVLVGEGEKVTAGQVVARVDLRALTAPVAQANAAVKEAESRVAAAKLKVQREAELLKAGVSAKQEYEDAEVNLRAAEAQLSAALAGEVGATVQRDYGELRAPFDGVVAKIAAGVGEMVDASKPVVEVVRADVLELRGGIPPDIAARLQPGAPAEIVAAGAGTVQAQVTAVAPAVDPTTGAVTVRVRVQNPGALRVGQTARAQLQLDRRENALAVPTTAIVPAEDGGRAVVTVQDGKSHLTPVQTGASDGRFTELRSGLAEGAAIVSDVPYALPEGTPLAATPTDSSAPPSDEAPAASPGDAGRSPDAVERTPQ